MCGRFNLRTNPAEFAEAFNVLRGLESLADFRPRSNVVPTTRVLAFRDAGGRELFAPKWGLIPSWSKDAKMAASCINARSE